MTPIWNRIEFGSWFHGKLEISVNEYGDEKSDGNGGPIVLGLAGSGYDGDCDQSIWIMPAVARDMAQKLLDAAAAVDAAGRSRKKDKGSAQ